jgi:hypothetical protein
MSLKFVLMAAAAGVGVFYVVRKLSPVPQQQTPLGQLGQGIQSLADAIKGSGSGSSSGTKPTSGGILGGSGFTAQSGGVVGGFFDDFSLRSRRATSPTGIPLAGSPFASYATATGDGDAAISDALGRTRIALGGQPTYATSWGQVATEGIVPSSPFAIRR